MGVFEYSDVDNAASFPLDGKVDGATITERRNLLMAIQKKDFAGKLEAVQGTDGSRAGRGRIERKSAGMGSAAGSMRRKLTANFI